MLDTQKASGSDIRSFAADLDDLSGQLRTSDSDLRTVLDRGVVASQQVDALLRENRTNLGALLTNLVTVGQVTVTRTKGIRQMFITYPDVVRGGYTVVPGDGTAHFGLQLNVTTRRPAPRGTAAPSGPTRSRRPGLPPLNSRARGDPVRGAQTPAPGTAGPSSGRRRPCRSPRGAARPTRRSTTPPCTPPSRRRAPTRSPGC